MRVVERESTVLRDDAEFAPVRSRRRSRDRRIGAIVAVLLVLVGAFLFRGMTPSATASIPDVLGAFERRGDRAFRIRVEPTDHDEKHGLDGGTLYTREHGPFVLVRVDPKGREIFDGFDGRLSWRIRGGTLVEEKQGPGAGGIPAPQMMADVPFADLRETMATFGVNYEILAFDRIRHPDFPNPVVRLAARRKEEAAKGPPELEIFADATSGTPRRIVFDRAKFRGATLPRRLTFELASETSLPEDWFRPTRHLGGVDGRGR